MSKSYVGIVRDHTLSMRSIARAAAQDYNSTVTAMLRAAGTHGIDTIVSVVKCGHGGLGIVHREIVNSNVNVLQPIPELGYQTDARSTPLFDAVAELIDILQAAPDYCDPNVSFLVMATTDGADNSSRISGSQLAKRMADLVRTDRWTFVFRVPKGHARDLVRLGIPAGNVLEWDQTEKGVQVASKTTTEAITGYFDDRSKGKKSTTKFYANLADITVEDAKKELTDISSEVQFWPVAAADGGTQIRAFVEARLGGAPMVKGGAFYKLHKVESRVQDTKRIAIRDRSTGAVYAGDAARQMLALPTIGDVRLVPDDLGQWDVYIQSTSVNRKLDTGTELMYWPAVGVAYKEGPSAR